MKALSLLLSLFLLVACSRAKLAWQLADNVVRYETSRHFDLESEQKDILEKDLKILKIEIEKAELQSFLQLTKAANELAQEKFQSKEKYEKIRLQLETILKSASKKMTPLAQKTVATLKPEQWTHFEKKMRNQFKEDAEKLKNNEFQKNAKKRWLRILDYFFGDMTDDQEKMIEKFVTENPFNHELRIQNANQMLEQFLKVKNQETERNSFLKKYFEDHDQLRIPEYHKQFMAYQTKLNVFIPQLLQTMNTKQLKAFTDRMQSLQEAFADKVK